MAKGDIYITVKVAINTGDDTPMEAVLEDLAGSLRAKVIDIGTISEAVHIEPPGHVSLVSEEAEIIEVSEESP